MIKYNKIQIKDKNSILLDIEVENLPYYSDIKIRKVNIYNAKSYPSRTVIGGYGIAPQAPAETHLEVTIPVATTKDLIIIEPVIEGVVSPDTPCGKDEVNLAVLYDEDYINSLGLGYLRELGDTCNIPRGFIDFILRKHALDMSIATCNYNEAIKYWNMFTISNGTTLKGCGCRGK